MLNSLYRAGFVCAAFFAALFSCVFLIAGGGRRGAFSASAATREKLPFSAGEGGVTAGAVYVVGGYHSVDNGVPAWGTADYADVRMIGDEMGRIVVSYTDGSSDSIPLIFGYTMWFYNNWQEICLPFRGDGAVPELAEALKSSLRLKGAFEGEKRCVIKIIPKQIPISGIEIADNERKNGKPVFPYAYLAGGSAGEEGVVSYGGFSFDTGDEFFDNNYVNCSEVYPESVKNTLDSLRRALYTFEDEYSSAGAFEYPGGYEGERIMFSGDVFAGIANGIIHNNLENLASRTDDDGFMHTSYENAPSWRYDGFGPWVENAGSYYDSFYSRDGARGIMSLLSYGMTVKAEKAAAYANRQMMYFPDNSVKFGGSDVPGHYTVVVNKPMLYSEVLVPAANWPTAYTKEAFGDECGNLGNQETDGHGLMMLANYNVWRALGRPGAWVKDNWQYIKEGAAWIEWCFDNPKLSFVRNGLLYAESEAGMKKYTLYCNIPCWLGLLGYSEMAASAGYTGEAEKWSAAASGLRNAIVAKLSGNGGWKTASFGFFHDPVVPMMADFYGFDVGDMDPELAGISAKTYENDTAKADGRGWYGAAGIGYDHSMLTQNALLSDNMKDSSELVRNLCRICFAPGLPEPYLVPEGISADVEASVLRRQGDLGNLVQLAEVLKCFDIVTGVSSVNGDVLKIMPRLPGDWSVKAYDAAVPGDPGASADVIVSYPENGVQTAQVRINGDSSARTVRLRMGPMPVDTAYAELTVNGVNKKCELFVSGDSAWLWAELGAPDAGEFRVAARYGKDAGSLPELTPEWTDIGTDKASGKNGGNSDGKRRTILFPIIISVCVFSAGAFAAVLAASIKKKGKR